MLLMSCVHAQHMSNRKREATVAGGVSSLPDIDMNVSMTSYSY